MVAGNGRSRYCFYQVVLLPTGSAECAANPAQRGIAMPSEQMLNRHRLESCFVIGVAIRRGSAVTVTEQRRLSSRGPIDCRLTPYGPEVTIPAARSSAVVGNHMSSCGTCVTRLMKLALIPRLRR